MSLVSTNERESKDTGLTLRLVETEEDERPGAVESCICEERNEPVLDPLRCIVDRGVVSLKGRIRQSRGTDMTSKAGLTSLSMLGAG